MAAPILLSLAGLSCGNAICNDMWVPGIVLQIERTDSRELGEATISFVRGDDEDELTCLDEECQSFGFGEAGGTYEVSVVAAGYSPATLTVDVEHDGCKPETQYRTVVLEPE